jgi:glycosidase
MIALYSDIVRRYDIAGVRIDTVKHVNDQFWKAFAPALLTTAAEAGHPDFLMFGEVFSSDPIYLSRFTTSLGIPGVLDFRLNDALQQYVAQGLPASTMVDAFDDDDWYTDADSSASLNVTFFGNHDIGRMGWLIDTANPSALPATLLDRMELGFDLLFTSRGVPVVSYGDEQGFVGTGGDQQARQSMFPSVVPDYRDQETIGSDATPGDDNFDPDHPLYRRVSALNQLRIDHPTLVTGAQIIHEPAGPVLAFSRIDRTERIEYVVMTNNSLVTVPVTVPTLTASTEFSEIWPLDSTRSSTTDEAGGLRVEVPPLSSVVMRAAAPLPTLAPDPTITLVRPSSGTEIPTIRYRIEAALGDRRFAEVTFAISIDGNAPQVVGTDDAPPYRVYWDNGAIAPGSTVEIIATVDDGSGRLRSDSVTVIMGAR